MAGATFVFAWVAYASLFVSQVQAGWEMLSPGDMPRDVVRRQFPPSPNGPRIVIDAGFGMYQIEHRTSQEIHLLTWSMSQDSHGTTQLDHNMLIIDRSY